MTAFWPVLLLFAASAVYADENMAIEKPVAADTAQKFLNLAAFIRNEMDTGGRYEFIKPSDKQLVAVDLDTMAAMLQKSGAVANMSSAEKLALFNVQEHVNGLLTHNDSERLVCEHVNPIGSHIPQTTCRTYGAIERYRQKTGKMFQDASLKWPSKGGSAMPGDPNAH
jgi:hypothetical protein